MNANNQALQVFYGTIPLIVVILLAIWINNKRIEELSKRIDDLRSYMTSEIASLREFIRSEIRRVEDRIERLEHPILRS